jgi:hypothetical protein
VHWQLGRGELRRVTSERVNGEERAEVRGDEVAAAWSWTDKSRRRRSDR